MFKQTLITSIAAAGLLLTAQASAFQYNGNGAVITVKVAHGGANHGSRAINKEQSEQAVMIQQGIKTCQITPREASTLQAEQAKINKLERRLSKDGLTRWEVNKLQGVLKTARIQINSFTKNRSTCGRSHNKRDWNKQGKRYDNSYSQQQRRSHR